MLLQYLANGIVNGSNYVLVAVGLTLIFGILHVVNFAHGEFYMLGAYTGLILVTNFGWPIWAALGGVLMVAIILGIGAEGLLHKMLKDRDATSSIIASFGLAVVLQNSALLAFGPTPMMLQTEFSTIGVEMGPVYLPLQQVLIPIAMVLLIALLYAVLRYTWTGRSLRAMAQHATVASLCGVQVRRVAIIAFIVAALLAGVAGFLMSSVYMVYPIIGNMIVLKAFTVVILGGMGNVAGAAAAGLLLGVIESLTSAYLGNGLRDIVGFVIVIAVLLVRPQGLFGKTFQRS
nr:MULTISPECIES: branched-chain amino acid ABC transporter permease [unclassified Bordetella]